MSSRRRQLGFIGQISGGGAVVTGVVEFVIQVGANAASALGQWVTYGVMILGAVLLLVSWRFRHGALEPDAEHRPDDRVIRPMPQVGELVGRRDDIRRTIEGARSHGLVVVHGPDGIGAGSVAIKAAEKLVPDPVRQRYVDLRTLGRDEVRRSRIQVLRTLGVAPGFFEGLSERQCADLAAQALVSSGGETVLVIDNVTGIHQIDWMHGVHGAFVIIAGDVPAKEMGDRAAAVAVRRLSAADAFTLLRAQEAAVPVRRRRSWWPHRTRAENSIEERIYAHPAEARELAEVYLRHPRVAIELGRWLARNRHVTFKALLADLRRDTENFELRVILRRQLDGASPRARRLLSLLAVVPEAEYTDTAVAALARLPLERASAHLAELTSRFVVEQTSSRYRLAPGAAQLAERAGARGSSRAAVRLAAYLAELAAAHAERPIDDLDEDWFKTEDVTLLRLLNTAGLPKKTGPHLWRIADALERWFSGEHRLIDRTSVAEAMEARAEEFGDQAALAVARMRLAAVARARGRVELQEEYLNLAAAYRHRRRVPWLPQLYTERALLVMATGDLHGAREAVRRCWEARPLRDDEGRLIDSLNFAVIDIKGGEYESAHRWLREALDLAEALPDLAGQAQARELRGIVHWEQGDHADARRDWDRAGQLYWKAGDDLGRARCARHVNQAAVV